MDKWLFDKHYGIKLLPNNKKNIHHHNMENLLRWTILVPIIKYWWLSARMTYLQCVSNGNTTVLHKAIEIKLGLQHIRCNAQYSVQSDNNIPISINEYAFQSSANRQKLCSNNYHPWYSRYFVYTGQAADNKLTKSCITLHSFRLPEIGPCYVDITASITRVCHELVSF